MPITTLIFFAFAAHVQAQLLAQRRLLTRPWRLGPGMVRMWIWPGFFRRLVPAYLAYYRPGFHPDDRDTSLLVASWRERLFGDGGELVSLLRGTWAADSTEPA